MKNNNKMKINENKMKMKMKNEKFIVNSDLKLIIVYFYF